MLLPGTQSVFSNPPPGIAQTVGPVIVIAPGAEFARPRVARAVAAAFAKRPDVFPATCG